MKLLTFYPFLLLICLLSNVLEAESPGRLLIREGPSSAGYDQAAKERPPAFLSAEAAEGLLTTMLEAIAFQPMEDYLYRNQLSRSWPIDAKQLYIRKYAGQQKLSVIGVKLSLDSFALAWIHDPSQTLIRKGLGHFYQGKYPEAGAAFFKAGSALEGNKKLPTTSALLNGFLNLRPAVSAASERGTFSPEERNEFRFMGKFAAYVLSAQAYALSAKPAKGLEVKEKAWHALEEHQADSLWLGRYMLLTGMIWRRVGVPLEVEDRSWVKWYSVPAGFSSPNWSSQDVPPSGMVSTDALRESISAYKTASRIFKALGEKSLEYEGAWQGSRTTVLAMQYGYTVKMKAKGTKRKWQYNWFTPSMIFLSSRLYTLPPPDQAEPREILLYLMQALAQMESAAGYYRFQGFDRARMGRIITGDWDDLIGFKGKGREKTGEMLNGLLEAVDEVRYPGLAAFIRLELASFYSIQVLSTGTSENELFYYFKASDLYTAAMQFYNRDSFPESWAWCAMGKSELNYRMGRSAFISSGNRKAFYRKAKNWSERYLQTVSFYPHPEEYGRASLHHLECTLLYLLDADSLPEEAVRAAMKDSLDRRMGLFRSLDLPKAVRRGHLLRGMMHELEGHYGLALDEYQLSREGLRSNEDTEPAMRLAEVWANKLENPAGAANLMSTRAGVAWWRMYVATRWHYELMGKLMIRQYSSVEHYSGSLLERQSARELEPLIHAIRVAAFIAMLKEEEAKAEWQTMLSALESKHGAYGIPFGLTGLIDYLQENGEFEGHDAWLVALFQAFTQPDRDAILSDLKALGYHK